MVTFLFLGDQLQQFAELLQSTGLGHSPNCLREGLIRVAHISLSITFFPLL